MPTPHSFVHRPISVVVEGAFSLEELRLVETDAAGADDRHLFADGATAVRTFSGVR